MQQQQPSSQQQGLLEDLLTPINQSLTTFPNGDLFWDTSYNEEDDSLLASSSSSFLQLISSSSIEPSFPCSCFTGETVDFPSVLPNLDSFTPGNVSNSSSYGQQMCEYEYENEDKLRSMVSVQEGYPTMVEQEDDDYKIHEEQQRVVSNNQIPFVFTSGEKKSKSKKVEGQPSKNLMAERRRRKRLNDRLSMLRSIVPRISKMDRTSILGDTIEYMKDLLEKIHDFKDQDMGSDLSSLNLMGSFKDLKKTNEVQARNPPKFEVERRNMDTRIQICCSSKPGLLVSTVNTLEALGLDIQQCVISSFSDFSLQASCSEAQENRTITSSEDIKQILFRNAGYGGRCL
ncbi:hypothetical protein L6452_44235 [Arctium lappa]|uniref:Uncharacterized protein n=1 Tax=Arctium lappa TaxID=4217 RepID=A0ACB8XGA0_ARCLA|nr:hypothetical protein L6452_44235 [Arctium lappa]